MSTDAQQAGGERYNRAVRSPRLLLLPWLAVAAFSAHAQGPPIVREGAWEVTVTWVRTEQGVNDTVAEGVLTVTPSRADAMRATVPWPGRGDLPVSASVRFDRVGGETEPDRLAFTFEVGLGSSPVRTPRTYPMQDGGSQVVEVAREGEVALLALLRAERTWRPRVRPAPSTTAPFVVHLALARIDGERVVPLETNVLHTFLGEPVEYSFRFGAGDAEQLLRVVFTPVGVTDDVADLRVQVTGKLPSDGTPVLLSRDQRLVASRGATSSLDVVAGSPPAGYRFSITPDF